MVIRWENPPSQKETQSKLIRVEDELMERPNTWALIHEGPVPFFPWYTPLAKHKDFEVRHIFQDPTVFLGPRKVYARYIGRPIVLKKEEER